MRAELSVEYFQPKRTFLVLIRLDESFQASSVYLRMYACNIRYLTSLSMFSELPVLGQRASSLDGFVNHAEYDQGCVVLARTPVATILFKKD